MGESRCSRSRYDGVVVGSGPNGLSAAITLAREGLSVLVIEAAATIGGGTRSAPLTLPGFVHDVCSAVHPFAVASPFFKRIPLVAHGLELIHPPAPLAHPLDDGTTAVLERSIEETARSLGPDAQSYRRLMEPLAEDAELLFADLLGPLRLPGHPISAARFGLQAIQPATRLASRWFSAPEQRALLAGLAAHSILPLEWWTTAAIGLVLGIAGHSVGWPIVRGGSQGIAESLAAYLRSLGGEIVTGWRVESIDELPEAGAVLLDVTPRQLVAMAGHRLPARYLRALNRYRYGAGVFKLDWALSGPIPWTSRDCCPGRHRAPRWHARGGRRFRVGRRPRRAPGTPVRAPRSTQPLRPDACSAGPSHRLGLLSRPQQLDGRHDRPDRSPGRTVRARIPRPNPQATRDGSARLSVL